jgi:adenylyltransferase/sulfurtransferase
VLGVLPGVIGSLQALEVIKIVLGTGKTLSGRLLIFDALELSWREVALRRNPDCPVCGDEPTQTGLIDYENFCGLSSAAEAEPESSRFDEVNAKELQARLSGPHPPFLLDVREPFEWDIVSLQEDGAVLVPLGELAERLGELPEGRDIVVYCRSGVRSARAAGLLVEAGLGPVSNLVGGVLAWVDEIDPSLPKY